MLDVAALRAQTGVCEKYTYLNNARVSPYPRPTLDAMQHALSSEYSNGWGEEQPERVIDDVKGELALLINATAAEIALVQSASYAINIIVNGLNWRSGDNVIPDLAYRSVAQSLLRLRDEKGVQLRIVSSDHLLLDPAKVLSAVDEKTRLVVVEQLPVFCGVPQPIAEIGAGLAGTRAHFAVNATQAVGQLPVDVKKFECDFLFGSSRKWLRGPRGLGFLYVREPLLQDLRPTNLGYPAGRWTGPQEYEVANGIDRLQVGDYPYTLLIGLAESVRYARSVGIRDIADRNQKLGRLCRDTLLRVKGVELYDAEQGITGTVPLNITKMDGGDTVKALLEKGIVTCTIVEENALLGLRKIHQSSLVRAAFHYYNTEDEVEILARALSEIAA